jgi:ubiquinone/menaquinone biosynthesis C-methylase UbiE
LSSKPNLNQSVQAQNSYRIAESLCCPACQSLDLVFTKKHIYCQQCLNEYPFVSNSYNQYPFLFADSVSAWQGWFDRLSRFNTKLSEKIKLLEKSLLDKKNSKLSVLRIKKIIRANQIFQKQVNNILSDFNHFDAAEKIHHSFANNQTVDSYINNIFRDWCWENGENDEMLAALSSVIVDKDFSAGKLLAIGAGASRLIVDFQQQYDINHCVLLDLNPLLLNVANIIINGGEVELVEFPTAPISSDDYAIAHTCKMPANYSKIEPRAFEFLLADATNIPLADKSFDTIVTPWLIDILPINFRDYIPHINRLLPVGGHWLNTGSLAFFNHNEAINYSQEEVLDLLKKYGFEVLASNRMEINYLHSPYSAHARVENVFNFCVRKKHDCVPVKRLNYLPDWIADASMIIPDSEKLTLSSSKHLLQAQVLSAINGHRSSHDIAKLIAKEYGMSVHSAGLAVRQILIDNYS